METEITVKGQGLYQKGDLQQILFISGQREEEPKGDLSGNLQQGYMVSEVLKEDQDNVRKPVLRKSGKRASSLKNEVDKNN